MIIVLMIHQTIARTVPRSHDDEMPPAAWDVQGQCLADGFLNMMVHLDMLLVQAASAANAAGRDQQQVLCEEGSWESREASRTFQ